MTLLLATAAALLFADAPVPSTRVSGPHGLQGWTLNYTAPDESDERLPMTLIIARHGRVLHRIPGDPFLWRWIFLDNGRKVAYEAAPLHFSSHCVLRSIASGKILAEFNCFPNPLPANAPSWVKTLQQSDTPDDLAPAK